MLVDEIIFLKKSIIFDVRHSTSNKELLGS